MPFSMLLLSGQCRIGDDADRTAAENEEDGACGYGEDLHGKHGDKDKCKEDAGKGLFLHLLKHTGRGAHNEKSNGDTDSGEGIGHVFVGHEGLQKIGDGKNNNKRGQDNTESCAGRAKHASFFVANVGGHVDGDGAGGGFCNGDDLRQLIIDDPSELFNDLLADLRDHGITAAKGKGADLKIGPKELPKQNEELPSKINLL